MSQRRQPNVSSQKKPPRPLQEPATDASDRPVAGAEGAPSAAFDEHPTATYSRPLAKLSPRPVVVPRAASPGNRTQVFTSGALVQPRPTPTREPPAPASAESPATVGDRPRPDTAPSGWTLERKLLAANMVLVLVAIVEFFVL